MVPQIVIAKESFGTKWTLVGYITSVSPDVLIVLCLDNFITDGTEIPNRKMIKPTRKSFMLDSMMDISVDFIPVFLVTVRTFEWTFHSMSSDVFKKIAAGGDNRTANRTRLLFFPSWYRYYKVCWAFFVDLIYQYWYLMNL
jgi:hypothetical protein